MKEVLVSLRRLSINWANKQLFNVVLNLDEEKQRQDITSSFPGLRATCSYVGCREYLVAADETA